MATSRSVSSSRRRAVPALALFLAFAVPTAACGGSTPPEPEALGQSGAAPANYEVQVVAEYPHDADAFTQGLVWAREDELFESTGQRGASTLRRVRIDTGAVLEVHELGEEYFGEGLAKIDDRLIQLTWQEETAFVYDESFAETGDFQYSGEGWGLCFDGERLVMSDGSSTLAFRDPESFEVDGKIRVEHDGTSLSSLNELECVGDRVYANVLNDNRIYEIDPASGQVTAVIDATALVPDGMRAGRDVLNGIAYSPDSGHFYLTGKNWPTLYEVTFEPAG
jgi:glutamine cyclotransferase